MTAAEIIRDIRRHGGDLSVDGDHLTLTAARPLPDELLQQLRARKADLLGYLAASQMLDEVADPADPCSNCGRSQWWRVPGEPWHCRLCEADMPLEAATLTLPSHKPQTGTVRDPARLRRMVEDACRGLSITPEQLWTALEENGDLTDVECGALSPDGLRLVAESTPSEAEQMLTDNPEIVYAVTTGTPDPDGYEVIDLAIRDKGSCTLRIPRDKYDGLKIMELLETATSPHDPAGGTRH